MSDPLIVQGPEQTTVPLVVTQVDAPDPNVRPAGAPPLQRGDTEYVILVQDEDEFGNEFWTAVEGTAKAKNPTAAVEGYAEDRVGDIGPDGVRAVAVPTRNWKPVRLKPQTVTTLVIEDA